MFDVGCSLVVLAVMAVVGVAWLARRAAIERYRRVDKDGGSALLGTGAMNVGYWALQPVGRALAAAGITPDGITLGSLGIGVGAGVALGAGHFGLGALLASVGFLGDALDGMVARATGVASDAGEVLDAAADRWGEFAFVAGVAVAYRTHVVWLVLALVALAGAFMVSYATAKAEGMQVEAPRGAMRRVERAAYLTGAAMLVPLATLLARHLGASEAVGQSPMLVALALVGAVGNISAARRLAVVAAMLRDRDKTRTETNPPPLQAAAVRREHGLLVLLRHQAGSIASTAVDFAIMIAAVEFAHVVPALATAIGASAGAVTNFTLGRRWIFRGASAGATGPQAARYGMVSAASLGLNTLGEYLLAQRLGLPYVLARLGVAVAVSILWNFPMQRWFVFGTAAEADG